MSELKAEWKGMLEVILHPIGVFAFGCFAFIAYVVMQIPPPPNLRDYDAERQQELFFQCLGAAKGVNKAGHYNDSNEVIESCSRISRGMAQDEYESGGGDDTN